MAELGPETLRALGRKLHDWYRASAVPVYELTAESIDAYAAAWEADRNRDRERIRVLEGYIGVLGARTECHHPECAQFTGPYDLGELEPPCTCGYDALMAGA